MSLPGGRGVRAAGGLHAAWERQQLAAQLAAVAGRIPQLAASKPAFFAAQLQPVLAALRQAAAASWQCQQAQQGEAAAATGGSEEAEAAGEAPWGSGAGGQQAALAVAAAAAQLRRLMWVDRHAGANASLLLWLLLEMASQEQQGWDGEQEQGQAELLAAPLLLLLVGMLGWQPLLLQALPLLGQERRQLVEAGMVAAAGEAAAAAAVTAAADVPATNASLGAVQQLVGHLVDSLRQQLERGSSSGGSTDSAAVAGWEESLLAGMALLQQLLLVCPPAVAAPAAAAALRRLQAAADACRSELMQTMLQQQPPPQQHHGTQQQQQQQQQQALFQQLCQLGARLMLALAAASGPADAGGAGGTGGGDTAASAAPCTAPAGSVHVLAAVPTCSSSSSQPTPGQAWHAVLQMPPRVAGAAAAAAAGGASRHASRLEFLAGRVAASCYLQAARASSGVDGVVAGSGSLGGSPSVHTLHSTTTIAALPGVRFQGRAASAATAAQPPVAAAALQRGSAGMASAAEVAAAEVAADPACLGAAQLTLATFQLADRVAAGAGRPASSVDPHSDWALLLDLAAAAASGGSTEPRQQQQQRALLLVLLHGQRPWQRRLLRALAADSQLQQSCRRQLVAVANRLASDAGTNGRPGAAGACPAPAAVHGDERRRRTAAAVAALLPHALLCPEAVLERLAAEALVQQGGQVDLLLQVLHEMRPLALYRPPGQEQPLLLGLLARLLAPPAHKHEQQQQRRQQQAVVSLDTPGSREAFLQLAAGLCGVGVGRGQAKARAADLSSGAVAAAAADADGPLLSPAEVLEHAVVPALQLCQLSQQWTAAAVHPADALQLPLQLAELLVCSGGASPGAAGVPSGPGAQPAAPQPELLISLRPLLLGLLDFEARRVDRSAAALAASLDTLNLAASLLQRLPDGAPAGSVGESSSGTGSSAGAYFLRQLQPFMPAPAGGRAPPPPMPTPQQQRQQLQRLRRAMPQLLAALLPCCTAAEGREVLQEALPGAVQSALLPPAPAPPAGASGGGGGASGIAPSASSAASSILPGAHAAAVEAACRAAQALALCPDQAAIAGELPAAAHATGGAGAAAPPPAAAEAAAGGAGGSEAVPSALRQVAVERMLQHLTQHCAWLAAAAMSAALAAATPAAAAAMSAGAAAAAVTGAGTGQQPGLTAAEGQALALRCFRELCQLAAALAPAGYDCATLQAGLLQLAQQQRQVAARHPAPAAAREAVGQQEQQQQPLAMLPAEQVQAQLAAATGVLPEGRLRDLVLLAVQAE